MMRDMAAPTVKSNGSDVNAGRAASGLPGLLLVFSAGSSTVRALALDDGPLELGRVEGTPGELADGKVSRRHAVVELQRGRCVVTDLGSTNGTFVDGKRIPSRVPTPMERVVRVGGALLVPCKDVTSIRQGGVRRANGFVYGPAMQAIVREAERAARTGTTLHIRGETGSGKEGIAEAFHRATGRTRTPVMINCATIPEALAERLLFGARRGAFSGAEDATGHLQEADGSTLFLDEVGELDLPVQAKLLRVLESREVVQLGMSKSRKIDFALCTATHKDLRALVEARSFREDLYFRISRPVVTLPPLRDRVEEIPALVEHVLSRREPLLAVHASLVELCLLRPWPGNVRELLGAIDAAAARAIASGDKHVGSRHLADDAGTVFGNNAAVYHASMTPALPEPPATPRTIGSSSPEAESHARMRRQAAEWRPRIVAALQDFNNNKAAAARELGLHVTELRRLIKRFGIATIDSNDANDRNGHNESRDDVERNK
jgi:DNA-binding NtrC family response regulator